VWKLTTIIRNLTNLFHTLICISIICYLLCVRVTDILSVVCIAVLVELIMALLELLKVLTEPSVCMYCAPISADK
jgi:hypothetical protein